MKNIWPKDKFKLENPENLTSRCENAVSEIFRNTHIKENKTLWKRRSVNMKTNN